MNNKVFTTLDKSLRFFQNLRLVDQRQLYRLWEQNHLRQVFERYDVDCVFDVGANYGQHAEMLRKHTGFRGLIISFEPTPEAAAVLRQKAARDPKWVIQEMAISTHDGEQTFNLMNDSEFSSLSAPKTDETSLFGYKNSVRRSVIVKTETLQTALTRLQSKYGFERPFLKLDTQGFDVEIVSHAKNEMSRFVGLQSELAVTRLYESSVDFREALTLYESCGFKLSAFVPNNAGHFPVLLETDCIMIRSDLVHPEKMAT